MRPDNKQDPYLYYIDDRVGVRFDFDREGVVERVLISGSSPQAPSSPTEASSANREVQFFLALLHTNNGKAFCIPATAKVGEISSAMGARLKADGKTQATGLEMIAALAAIYPCSVGTGTETASSVHDIKQGTRLHSYLYAQQRHEELYKVGVDWDKRLGLLQSCKSTYQVRQTALGVISPITLASDKEHPTAGVWLARFEFERCSEVKVYNAIFVSKNGEAPDVRPYYPGSSIASVRLISDAMPTAMVVASRQLSKNHGISECKEFVLSDTAVTEPPHDVAEGGQRFSRVWKEKWAFLGCGKLVDVFIEFVPDGKGGTNYIARES